MKHSCTDRHFNKFSLVEEFETQGRFHYRLNKTPSTCEKINNCLFVRILFINT